MALCLASLQGCGERTAAPVPPGASYLDSSGRSDVLAGGVRLIPIQTPKGAFRVWTKRVGNNPRVKVLLLHGGPGATHEYFEAFDSYFPAAGIEYYYYDQLGSAFSDQPNDPELWEVPRFVNEVEQVRQGLGLDRDSFYLLGHSWGGILAMEYALKYPEHLKGLVISNMMASIPAYGTYAENVLMPEMDQAALAEIRQMEATGRTEEPRYMELLMPHHYEKHVLRMPGAEWPDPVNRGFAHINRAIYVPMQGPSELGVSGKLAHWDRTADLGKITTPTLVIGAQYDTMDPAHMKMMSEKVQRGRYLFCPHGSHMAMYDDQKAYFDGLIRFVQDVDGGRFWPMSRRFLALLRGVNNIGASRRVAMADLRALFERLGFTEVRTLLNSGNVVFTSPGRSREIGARIQEALTAKLRLDARVLLLSSADVAGAVRDNPFARVATNPSHLLVLVPRERADLRRLKPLLNARWSPERLALGPRVAYLWCARGVARSPVWGAVDRALDRSGTVRNIATFTKALALMKGSENPWPRSSTRR
jgi:proline iminopeptidase